MYLPPKPIVFALALGLPTTALAQMTPQDWLDEMSALYAAQGMNFTYASSEQSGDALVLSDLSMSFSADEAQAVISFDEMTIRPTAAPGFDLEVTASPDYIGTVTAEAEGVDVNIGITVTADGMYWVGGPENDRKIEFAYPEVLFAYTIADGAPEDMPPMDIGGSAQDVTGSVNYSLSDMAQSYLFGASSVGFGMKIEESPGNGADITLSYADVSLEGAGPIANMNDSAALFQNDDVSEFLMKAASSSLAANIADDGAETSIGAQSGATSLAIKMGGGVLDYLIGQEDMQLTVQGSAMPIPPVNLSFTRIDTRFALPMTPTDDAKEAAILLNFEGLVVDDMLWSMIDPGSALPRDPANITLDITAQGKALVDLSGSDPEAFMAAGIPWEFDSVSLNRLLLSIAGAKVTGSGEATINNGGFFPMPVGGLDIRLEGVTTLANKLVELGLAQQEQVMPMQMMLGMFAKPTGEPDTFESRIDMTEDGGILANGVPLQ